MNAVKRMFLVVGVLCLGMILVFLNQGLKKSAAPDVDEDEQAQQSKAAKPPPPAPIDPKTVLAPEETVGDPAKARHHIQVGWMYDENNQKKPETLAVPLQTVRDYVQKSGGIASAEIVNLDIPIADRTPAAQAVTGLGISVDGHPVSRGNPSSTPFPSDQIIGALSGPPPVPSKKPDGGA